MTQPLDSGPMSGRNDWCHYQIVDLESGCCLLFICLTFKLPVFSMRPAGCVSGTYQAQRPNPEVTV